MLHSLSKAVLEFYSFGTEQSRLVKTLVDYEFCAQS